MEKFLKNYFPESKTAKGKVEISSFHQFPDESLSEALDRFHGLLRKTPTSSASQFNSISSLMACDPIQSSYLMSSLVGRSN